VTKWNNKVIEVELPQNHIYEIVETEPNVKGNTVSGGSKPAKIETGATISVPLFIETGEKIRVDIAKGEYLSRANN